MRSIVNCIKWFITKVGLATGGGGWRYYEQAIVYREETKNILHLIERQIGLECICQVRFLVAVVVGSLISVVDYMCRWVHEGRREITHYRGKTSLCMENKNYT